MASHSIARSAKAKPGAIKSQSRTWAPARRSHRYPLADGSRPWEHVGHDLDEAIAARERKQAYFEALEANVPVVQDQDETGRTKITDAVYQWFAELQLFQGKGQQGKSEKTLRGYDY